MARDSRLMSNSRFVEGSLFRRDEPGNIAKPNKSFRGENSANQPDILPAVWAEIVAWRGFPGDAGPTVNPQAPGSSPGRRANLSESA
jgi:hypothetical protein